MRTPISGSRVGLIDDDRASVWKQARAELDGLPGGHGLNIAHEAVDRHAAGPEAGSTALRWVGKHDQVVDLNLFGAPRPDRPVRRRAVPPQRVPRPTPQLTGRLCGKHCARHWPVTSGSF